MGSIKTRLAFSLGLVELITLAMALVLYVGASRLEENAHRTGRANDEVRELLSFALVAHRYMNAFGQSLGQRTLVANHDRRTAAAAFESRIRSIGDGGDSLFGRGSLAWAELTRISRELHAELTRADELRERGDFAEAERIFNIARRRHFESRMLPWFEGSLSVLKAGVDAEEATALENARTLRLAGTLLGLFGALLGTALVIATATSILVPIAALLEGTEEVTRGNFGHRVTPRGKDELARLARRFNEMNSALDGAQQKLVERNAQLEEAHRLQGEFLSIVSHELRSPLHSVVGYTELVLDDEPGLSAQSRSNMNAIMSSARRLLVLINDILDFSKLRAGRMEAANQRFDLVPLLRQAVSDARALPRGRDLRISLQTELEALFIDSDEAKVRQILINLLSNAVKFTAEGAVTLLARREEQALELRVTDTGFGIPAEQLELIFEPFRQARGGHVSGGTGLGLAIVSRLTKLLGGRIAVQSEPGRGSSFVVSLPLSNES